MVYVATANYEFYIEESPEEIVNKNASIPTEFIIIEILSKITDKSFDFINLFIITCSKVCVLQVYYILYCIKSGENGLTQFIACFMFVKGYKIEPTAEHTL